MDAPQQLSNEQDQDQVLQLSGEDENNSEDEDSDEIGLPLEVSLSLNPALILTWHVDMGCWCAVCSVQALQMLPLQAARYEVRLMDTLISIVRQAVREELQPLRRQLEELKPLVRQFVVSGDICRSFVTLVRQQHSTISLSSQLL